MNSRTITSGSGACPAPKDFFRALLARMVETDERNSWSHFQLLAPGAWLKNLFWATSLGSKWR